MFKNTTIENATIAQRTYSKSFWQSLNIQPQRLKLTRILITELPSDIFLFSIEFTDLLVSLSLSLSLSRFLSCLLEYSRYLFPVTPTLIDKLRISDLVPLFSYSKVFFCFPSFSPLPNSLHLLILFDFIFSIFDCLNFFW